MKASVTQRSRRPSAVSLFEHSAEPPSQVLVRERVAQFARAVARRHLAQRGPRSERGDLSKMLAALRGYYLTWSLCASFRLPTLDEDMLAVATNAYVQACGVHAQSTAA